MQLPISSWQLVELQVEAKKLKKKEGQVTIDGNLPSFQPNTKYQVNGACCSCSRMVL
jgi:hypothetical protein